VDLILDTNALSAVGEGEASAVGAFSRADRLGIPVIVAPPGGRKGVLAAARLNW